MNAITLENPVIDVEIPYGVSLDVSRLGEYIASDEVEVGETVRFDYFDGETRNVLVTSTNNVGFKGLTLERDGNYRSYLNRKIYRSIKVVQPFVHETKKGFKRVRFDEAGDALLASLSGEQLAELYGKYVALEGDGAGFDSVSGEVVVKLPEPSSAKFIRVENTDYPLVIAKGNRHFNLFLYQKKQEVGICVDGGLNEENITPEQLRDELVKFLA